ncbi:MAG TPA: peptidyl-alpha-hydroxyglycine alpha-amidating lyase family protein [Xanthobacteraceae bacterium]|jgi:sugar lactone lactonase YvrE
MWLTREMKFALGFAIMAALAGASDRGYAQGAPDPNAAPNPYRLDEGWLKMPEGRKIGATFGLSIDRDGKSLWAFDRCASADFCAGTDLAPIFKFDQSGKVLANFGAGMFASPHGMYADRDGNIWATDFRAKDGKGHTVTKFSPDGKVLMTLGKAGMAGNNTSQDLLNAPSNTLVAPNGDVFVADGHGGDTNARIVKFSKDGKFLKAWGSKGTAPGQFDTPHMLAMDSAGRLFVADRVNNRIQIFDQDGQFLDEWKQFGRPSGVYINKNDIIYVSDSQSDQKTNPGFQQGIRVGSVKEKKVIAFIPETKELGALEGVAADDQGNIYAGYTNTMNLRRFVKK